MQTDVEPPPPVPPLPEGPQDETRLHGRVRRFLSVKTLVLAVVVAIVTYLAIVPLAYLFWGTFYDGDGLTLRFFSEAYTQNRLGPMLRNTFVFAAGSTVVAVFFGTVLAYLVVRTDVPMKNLAFAASLVPLVIPGILFTISWVFLASPRTGIINIALKPFLGPEFMDVFSMPGMIVIQGLNVAPLVFLLMYASFRSMDPAMEESALSSGASLLTVVRRITLPLVKPGLYAAILIMFVRGVEAFEVPAILGMPRGIWVMTSRIWQALKQFPPDFASAGVYSTTLLVIASIFLFFYNRMSNSSKRFQTVTGKGFRPRPINLGKWRWPMFGFVMVYFSLTVLLPILVLLFVSFQKFYMPPSMESFDLLTLDHYRRVFSQQIAVRALRNSVILSFTSATAVMFITAVAGWIVVRTRVHGRWIVDNLTFVPLMVPGLVLGVALLFVYLRSPIPIYGTLWILFIAYVTKMLPYGMRYIQTSMFQIGSELEESAQTSGATWLQSFRRVMLPLLVPGFMAGWIYAAIVTMRELSTSILLYSPGTEVFAVAIWEYWEDGVMGPLSALGVIMILILMTVVIVARRLGAQFGVRE